MYEQNCNFCINTIGNLINRTIEYYTTCKKKRVVEGENTTPIPETSTPAEATGKETAVGKTFKEGFNKATELFNTTFEKLKQSTESKKKSKKNKKLVSDELLFICSDSIVFIGEKINNGIKREIMFDNIQEIAATPGLTPTVMFTLKNGIKSKGKKAYTFILNNPGYFIENLNGKYQMYSVKKYGVKENFEIKVNYLSTLFMGLLTSNAGCSIFVDDFERQKSSTDEIHYSLGYKYYLDKDYIQHPNFPNMYEKIDKTNELSDTVKTLPSRILVNILKQYPIEYLTENTSNRSLKFTSLVSLKTFIEGYLPEGTQYWMKDCSKITKPIIENDISQWKGYKYELKTKPIKNKGYNILFFYLRRKYIPPFFESFNDIVIILREEYYENSKSTTLKQESINIVNKVVASIRPIQILERNEVSDMLIKYKLESYLVDGKTLNYLNTRVNIFGNESYKLSLDYKLKLALLYEKYEKERISEDYRIMEEIENVYLNLDDQEIDIDEYVKKIKFTSFEDLLEKQTNKINNFFELTDRQTAQIFQNKVANFLGSILLNKKISKDFFDKMLSLHRRLPDFAKVFNPILNYLLNIQVISNNNEIILNKNIVYIINNLSNINQINYNENLMIIFIANGILKDIQGLESDLVYCQFLNYILEHNFSIKLLSSITKYLERIKKIQMNRNMDEEDINDNSEQIKNLKIFIPTLMKLYSDYDNCNAITIESAKCLNILTFLDYQNRDILNNDEFFGCLYHYFSSCNQEILLYSIQLFSEILHTKCDMTKIIERNNGYIFKLINILKGTEIRDCYYHPELICYTLKFFIKIFKENSQIKIMLLKPKTRKFVKYLLKYIFDYEGCLGKEEQSYEYYFPVLKLVYDLLSLIIKRNTEMKKYIETNYHLIKLINQKCDEYLQIIESINEEESDQKISIKDFMLSVIKCISDYLGNDLFMIYNAKYYGKKISTFIIHFGEYLSTERESQNDNLLLCKELLKQLTN